MYDALPTLSVSGLATLLIAALGLTACSDLLSTQTEPPTTDVAVKMQRAGDQTASASKAGSTLDTPLRIQGEDGDLVVEDFRFILTKARLSTGEPGEWRGGPKANPNWIRNEFVDVPLDITEEEALGMLEDLPEGTYHELDVKIDENPIDEGEDTGADALRDAIYSAFPDWPEEASMVAVGRFEPDGGGAARVFTVYFDAEIRVHLELDPPIEIVDGEDPTVAIDFDPELLFQQLGEPSLDLSRYDGQVLEIEANVKDSFQDVKFEMEGAGV
jgi:hypothetical protein